MKIWMSRSRFELLTNGMSPIEKADLAENVNLYPDEMPRGWNWHLDRDRLTADWTRLSGNTAHARQLEQAAPPGVYWNRPRRNGKTASFKPGPPWTEIGTGVWIAPTGTPAPWTTVDQVRAEFDELREQEAGTRRYFLNDTVTGTNVTVPISDNPAEMLRQLMAVYARLQKTTPRRLIAGEHAVQVLADAYPPPPDKVPDDPARLPGVAALSSIPIVLDPGMPPTAWKLIDPLTGEVLFEGDLGPACDDYAHVIRDCLDDAADKGEQPPFLY